MLHISKHGEKLSENIQNQQKRDTDCLGVHMMIMTIKTGPRHSFNQPNKSNFRKAKGDATFFSCEDVFRLNAIVTQ